jgi:hypothetical protein
VSRAVELTKLLVNDLALDLSFFINFISALAGIKSLVAELIAFAVKGAAVASFNINLARCGIRLMEIEQCFFPVLHF